MIIVLVSVEEKIHTQQRFTEPNLSVYTIENILGYSGMERTDKSSS